MWDPASAESHTMLACTPIWARASRSDGRNAVRVPCVDPLAHEGHNHAGNQEPPINEAKEDNKKVRLARFPVERRQVKHVQDHGHGDLDETDLLVAKEKVAGTNSAEEKVEKARSLTRLTQHGSVESGLAVARLAVRLLTVCGLLTVARLAIRLLTVARLAIRLLTIAGLTVRLLPITRLLAVTSLLVITVTSLLTIAELLPIRLLTVGRLLVITVTGLLTVTSLLAIARLLTVTGLLTVRLLRSRHDVS